MHFELGPASIGAVAGPYAIPKPRYLSPAAHSLCGRIFACCRQDCSEARHCHHKVETALQCS